MSLIRKSDVKNHLSTRTGDTALAVPSAGDTGPSGNFGDSSQDVAANAAFSVGGVTHADGLVSSVPDAGKQKA
jgi:hypothetical protein